VVLMTNFSMRKPGAAKVDQLGSHLSKQIPGQPESGLTSGCAAIVRSLAA
jgi:hypothetical protein